MKISPEMRAAIDAAIQTKGVTVVPPNVSGLTALGPQKNSKRHAAGQTGTVAEKKREVARNKVQEVRVLRDNRRFKISPVPTGSVRIKAPTETTGTLFHTQVKDPNPDTPLLKNGKWNSKIGGIVLKGRLKGARIYTLTLEERATCPRSCDLWERCMGNAMQHSTRWRHGPDLEAALREEVTALCATPAPVLIRLHILGDFYSFDYLRTWVELLDNLPNLNVFGFTAWGLGTTLGDAIARVRKALGLRFAIRHSGTSGPWGAFTIDFPTEKKRLGSAIVCPEQADAMNGKVGRHCGNCALCWQADVPIVFVEH